MRVCASGFTLIEVMISLAIAALVLTALGGLQIALMRATTQATERFDRIRHMVYFLEESRTKNVEHGTKRTEVIEPVTLTYERAPTVRGSSIHDLNQLMIERVGAQWPGRMKKQHDTILTFVYNPEPPDETRTKPT